MLKFVVKCPNLGTIAVFAMIGDAEEWIEFYSNKYPNMTGLTIKEENHYVSFDGE